MPRDRNGDFEPSIVKKKQTRIAGLDQKIVSLYAKGMSLSDIKTLIQELYDTDISESLISKITEGVFEILIFFPPKGFLAIFITHW